MAAVKMAFDEARDAGLDPRLVGAWRVYGLGRHPIDRGARMVYAEGPATSLGDHLRIAGAGSGKANIGAALILTGVALFT